MARFGRGFPIQPRLAPHTYPPPLPPRGPAEVATLDPVDLSTEVFLTPTVGGRLYALLDPVDLKFTVDLVGVVGPIIALLDPVDLEFEMLIAVRASAIATLDPVDLVTEVILAGVLDLGDALPIAMTVSSRAILSTFPTASA